jgi:Kdo2-lipid IVA lauroyltransferase/acyltransferase
MGMNFNKNQFIQLLLRLKFLIPFVNTYLSRYKIIFAIKRIIFAEFTFRQQKTEREYFAQNLKKAMPVLSKKEINKISKKSWYSIHFSSIRLSILKSLDSDKLRQYIVNNVEIEGIENLKSACQDSQPIVFFTPHFGDFITGSMRLAIEGTKDKTFNVFYEKPDTVSHNAEFKPIIDKLHLSANVLLNDKMAILKGLRALKKGEALIMFADLAQMKEGSFFVPFFDQLVLAMGGTAFFASKSNAKLIPFYCYPTGIMKSKLIVKQPLNPIKTENLEESVYLLTKEIHADMERQLRETPEHWRYWADWDSWFPLNKSIRMDKNSDLWKDNLQELMKDYSQNQSEIYNFLKEFQARLT